MLRSYEAIYDHGQICWLSDAPTLDQARIIVTVLDETPALPAARRVPPPATPPRRKRLSGTRTRRPPCLRNDFDRSRAPSRREGACTTARLSGPCQRPSLNRRSSAISHSSLAMAGSAPQRTVYGLPVVLLFAAAFAMKSSGVAICPRSSR